MSIDSTLLMVPSRGRRWLGRLAAAVLVGAAGCGGNESEKPYTGALSPTTGQVVLANGKALGGGHVTFIPTELGKPGATGEIKSDGKFSLKMADGRDGAAPGDYKVRIEPSADLVKRDKKGAINPSSLPFDAHYSDADGDTGLTATVKAEATDLPPFKLDAPGTGAKKARASRDRD